MHILDEHLSFQDVVHRQGSAHAGYDQFAECLPVPIGTDLKELLNTIPSVIVEEQSFLDDIKQQDREISEGRSLVFAVGCVGGYYVAGKFPIVIDRAEQAGAARDGAEIRQLGSVDDAAVLRVAEQADHVVTINEAVGIEVVAQSCARRVEDDRIRTSLDAGSAMGRDWIRRTWDVSQLSTWPLRWRLIPSE